MADNEEQKNLEESKLTNEKLGKLTDAINEQSEDAEFARQEAAAQAEEALGSEEELQEQRLMSKNNRLKL